MTRLSHKVKKYSIFMYIFLRFTFLYTVYKVKKIPCTKLHVYRVYKSLLLWLYHHTDKLNTTILHTLNFFNFIFNLGTHILIPLFLKCELQRK